MTGNNINTLRQALFNELETLNKPEVCQDSNKLRAAIAHATAVSAVGNTIIESAKAEHNFMKIINRTSPLTDFIPVPVSKEDEVDEMLGQYANKAKRMQASAIERYRLKEAQEQRRLNESSK